MVPASDLHAFASGSLDGSSLALWLCACLALDWRGVDHEWHVSPRIVPLPTLGLLHPFAAGLATDKGDRDGPKLGLRPDWATQLIAGQVRRVHEEAVARLRQVGWEAVPWVAGQHVHGPRLAAALVPRCQGSRQILRMLANRTANDRNEDPQPPAEDSEPPKEQS